MFFKKNDSTFYLLSDKKKENALFSIDIFEKLWTEFGETREREKKIVKMFEKFLIRIGDKYFENREIFGCNWNRYFIYLFFLLLGNMSEKWWVKKKKIHLSRVCDFFRNDEYWFEAERESYLEWYLNTEITIPRPTVHFVPMHIRASFFSFTFKRFGGNKIHLSNKE